jgi:hypothetical protein
MAKEIFDFEKFSSLALKDYKREYAKAKVIKKAKAALIVNKYAFASNKTKHTLIIPFKKMDLAVLAYKAIKADKNIHKATWTSLVKVTHGKDTAGKDEVTLEIKKGGLAGELIQTELQELFDKVVMLGLNVVGTSDHAVEEGSSEDSNNDGVSDTAIDESTIVELKQEFQAAQKLYKESKSLDKASKVEALKTVSEKFKALMPKLNNFLEYADQKPQLQTAAKIKENILKFQTALSGNSTPSPEASNSNLDALTGSISTKAAQLLKTKTYQDEIASIDGLADKLKSISQIA